MAADKMLDKMTFIIVQLSASLLMPATLNSVLQHPVSFAANQPVRTEQIQAKILPQINCYSVP